MDQDPYHENRPKVISWEREIQKINWWDPKLNIKWNYTMLRDCHIFNEWYGKIVGSPRPHLDNIIFILVNNNLNGYHGPSYYIDPTSFWWA
jgi:hypothetical protein